MSFFAALLMPMGLAILLYTIVRHKQLVRIQWNSVASFLGFMAVVTMLRIGFFDFMADLSPEQFEFPKIPYELRGKPIWRFCLVFWEDAFFALPIYLAFKKCRKWLAWAVVIGLSVMFGQAHGYQGTMAMFITGLYPYFVSYRMGSKYGFGTVMVSHMLYDVITFYTIGFLPWLI